ncbi:DUF397 domain-containing protein [Amycolatopsis aidingensis]|uniref:DUF397 domain-containing protein n=1 Tax=Amycolatopsis aidingensis TaxID=2842453 RepID=UPI001C0AB0B2|nr:DUF397 domain-containing protein [Amycolatopsis aidingensis]
MDTHERWRTSSRSGNANECVELAVGVTRTRTRDTKNRDGGTLTLTDRTYRAFLTTVKDGRTAG